MNARLFTRVLTGAVAFLLLVALIWGSDRITLQGERTIYTVDCVQGTWDGETCTGRLAAGSRYAFRASKSRQEVIYWIRESQQPSGKLSGCEVRNRDNWSCATTSDRPPPVTWALRDGKPTDTAAGPVAPLREVPKWKWYAIRYGAGALVGPTAG